MSLSKHAKTDDASTSRRVLKCSAEHYGLANNITSLPDLCQLAIFDALPVSDLLHINKVCQKWKAFYSEACRRRTVLTLHIKTTHGLGPCLDKMYQSTSDHFISDNFNDYFPVDDYAETEQIKLEKRFQWSTLPYKTFGDQTFRTVADFSCELLRDRFPNIKTLDIVAELMNEQSINYICLLLTQWKDSLHAVNLWIWTIWWPGGEYGMNRSVTRLYSTLESIDALEELTCIFDFKEYYEHFPRKLPIFSKLKKFGFYSYPGTQFENDQELSRLESIKFNSPISSIDQIKGYFFSPGAHFADRFTHVAVNFGSNMEEYHRLVTSFVNLTSLSIDLDKDSKPLLMDIFTHLESLSRLSHLRLSGIWDCGKVCEVNAACVPVLPTVKCLSVGLKFIDRQNREINFPQKYHEILPLDQVFPNLELLRIEPVSHIMAPPNCVQNTPEDENFKRQIKEKYAQQFVPILSLCASLRCITFYANVHYRLEYNSEYIHFCWTPSDN